MRDKHSPRCLTQTWFDPSLLLLCCYNQRNGEDEVVSYGSSGKEGKGMQREKQKETRGTEKRWVRIVTEMLFSRRLQADLFTEAETWTGPAALQTLFICTHTHTHTHYSACVYEGIMRDMRLLLVLVHILYFISICQSLRAATCVLLFCLKQSQ